MHSNIREVDTEYRDVAIDYAEAEAVVARGEAARARVLARAAAIGNRRVAELGRPRRAKRSCRSGLWRRSWVPRRTSPTAPCNAA